jgi:hypothetical protein|tara:strand:+ start:108 stop:479 length:372 start_codon:yes stop_codon:yes gene_type:complete
MDIKDIIKYKENSRQFDDLKGKPTLSMMQLFLLEMLPNWTKDMGHKWDNAYSTQDNKGLLDSQSLIAMTTKDDKLYAILLVATTPDENRIKIEATIRDGKTFEVIETHPLEINALGEKDMGMA